MRQIMLAALTMSAALLPIGLLVGPAAAQLPEAPAPAPLVAPSPLVTEWSPRLTGHLGVGSLTHTLDPERRPSPVLHVSAAYKVDQWARAEVELMTASLSGTWSCSPVLSSCEELTAGTRLFTVLVGFRVETPPDRLQGFISAHNGLELDGRYQVFNMGVGGRIVVSDRLGIRGEARYRWDYRFIGRPPAGARVLLVGVEVSGPGGFWR